MSDGYQRQAAVVALAGSWFVPAALRPGVLRPAGVSAGSGSRIGRGVVVQGTGALVLASNCRVGDSVYFDMVADISIGHSVVIGDHVRILTSSHQIGPSEQRAGLLTARPIVIGDGCTIGPRAVIMPGVTIGVCAVVDADSLVTKDCEPHSRYAGTPAVRAVR